MAYGNLLASVPEPDVDCLRRDPAFVVTPSLVVEVSHLVGYGVKLQPIGGLLGQALDGGEPLHPELWHPLRPPVSHRPSFVVELSRAIGDAWEAARAGDAPEDANLASLLLWSGDVEELLRLFRHASESGECVVSALEPPQDDERARKVRLPWSEPWDA